MMFDTISMTFDIHTEIQPIKCQKPEKNPFNIYQDIEPMKYCKYGGHYKTISSFGLNGSNTVHPTCKKCRRAKQHIFYVNNKDYCRDKQTDWLAKRKYAPDLASKLAS